MKVYIAKDWAGPKVFASPPTLSAFSGLWSGHRLNCFDITNSFVENEIPKGKYIEREIWWSIVKRIEI